MIKRSRALLYVSGLALFAMTFCLALTATVSARDYDLYVDDSNETGVEDGTSANPYNTIGEALAQAQEDQAILIRKGTYEENIEIPEGVDVYGEDKDDVTIDGGKSGNTVEMNHKSRLQDVTVKGGDTGIRVPEKAGVKIKKVDVIEADHDGIVLEGSAATRKKDKYEREIIDCEIKDNDEKGIYIKKSQVTIEDSEISDNNEEGIDMRKDVKATIKDNKFKDNGESNIEFKIDDVKLTIKDNTIKKADASGIAAQSYQGITGEVTIEDNKIEDNKHYGIRCANKKGGISPGVWAQTFTLIANTYDDNKKGNYSSVCAF